MKIMSKNNALVELSLNKIMRKFNTSFKNKIERLIKEVNALSLVQAIPLLLSFFKDSILQEDSLIRQFDADLD